MHVTFYINKRMQLTPSPLGLTDLCLNSKYNTCSRPFFTAALLCTWLFAFSYMHSIYENKCKQASVTSIYGQARGPGIVMVIGH